MAKQKDYFDFKLEGAKELNKVFAGLPKAVGKRLIIAGLKDQAKPMLKDIRRDAPKDTGTAARSIKIRTMVKSKFPAITVGPGIEKRDDKKQNWAIKFVEFGSSRIAAKPFVRPAWDAHKERMSRGFITSTIQAIEKFAERLRKQAYAGKLSRAGRKALGI